MITIIFVGQCEIVFHVYAHNFHKVLMYTKHMPSGIKPILKSRWQNCSST